MDIIEHPLMRSTVAESCDLSLNVAKAIQNYYLEDAWLNSQTTQLKTTGEEMRVSIATDWGKEKTEELAALDHKRDVCVSALKTFCRAFIKWEHSEYPLHAQRIYEVIKKHGLRLDKESYEEESALLESLIADLQQSDIQESIQKLNLSELTTDMKEAQQAFGSVYRESANIEANKEVTVAATKLKKEAHNLLTQMVDYLNVMSIANPEIFDRVAAEVAELVNGLNHKIRVRTQN